jgi:hypothetical protein
MKYIFITLLSILFSCSSFAADSKIKKPKPGNATSKTTGKADTAAKKIVKLPVGNNQPAYSTPANVNQKLKKETAEESGDFYGPLSWRPALLY